MFENEINLMEVTPTLVGPLGFTLYLLFLRSDTLNANLTRLIKASKSSFYWIQLTRISAVFFYAWHAFSIHKRCKCKFLVS